MNGPQSDRTEGEKTQHGKTGSDFPNYQKYLRRLLQLQGRVCGLQQRRRVIRPKIKGRRQSVRGEMKMSFLSYKVLRGTCLRFPEQLEVIVTGDVLQQRLAARSVALTVLLVVSGDQRRRQDRKSG